MQGPYCHRGRSQNSTTTRSRVRASGSRVRMHSSRLLRVRSPLSVWHRDRSPLPVISSALTRGRRLSRASGAHRARGATSTCNRVRFHATTRTVGRVRSRVHAAITPQASSVNACRVRELEVDVIRTPLPHGVPAPCNVEETTYPGRVRCSDEALHRLLRFRVRTVQGPATSHINVEKA